MNILENRKLLCRGPILTLSQLINDSSKLVNGNSTNYQYWLNKMSLFSKTQLLDVRCALHGQGNFRLSENMRAFQITRNKYNEKSSSDNPKN